MHARCYEWFRSWGSGHDGALITCYCVAQDGGDCNLGRKTVAAAGQQPVVVCRGQLLGLSEARREACQTWTERDYPPPVFCICSLPFQVTDATGTLHMCTQSLHIRRD